MIANVFVLKTPQKCGYRIILFLCIIFIDFFYLFLVFHFSWLLCSLIYSVQCLNVYDWIVAAVLARSLLNEYIFAKTKVSDFWHQLIKIGSKSRRVHINVEWMSVSCSAGQFLSFFPSNNSTANKLYIIFPRISPQ